MSGIWVSIILYIFAAFALFLGIIVFLRNTQRRRNWLFLALSSSAALWIASNALYVQVDGYAAFIVALLSYAFAASAATSFFFFVIDLSGTQLRWRRPIGAVSIIAIISSAIPNVLATGVEDHVIATTPALLGYALFMVAMFGGGIFVLFRGRSRERGLLRRQISTVLLGLLIAIVGGVFFNLVLPLLGNYLFVQLGPVFSIFFVASSAYAVVRHRLFDLRATVLRVATYSLSVFSVAVLYGIFAFGVAQPLVGSASVDSRGEILYIALAVLVALTFQPIKRFFDRATRAVFYKNSYDSNVVLDHLGNLLVREVEVDRLVKHCLKLLAEAIKVSSVEVVLADGDNRALSRRIGWGKALANIEPLIHHLHSNREVMVVTDEVSEHNPHLHQILAAANVAAVAALKTSKEHLGYTVVGYKSSGDAFGDQDIDLIRVMADELAVAVQNALRFEEISRFNQTLRQEITDATAQLRDSNRKLKKLDEAKDEFISMASHQLRTPLTSVKGYISMALEGDAGPVSSAQRKLLEEAFMSSQRMVYLIGDFLNVSRLQTGKFVLEAKPVNLATLTREEINQLLTTAQRRNITLEYHQPTRFPVLQLDDNKMRQVIMNFIDNAIFYSKPDSKVLIALVATTKDVRLTVHDTGIGVPERERHHLFTKFYRAENARRARPDGTGIGLFMAKKVITAHGGSIIFESRENRGSTFGFSLPLRLEKQIDQLEQDKHHD